MESVPQFTQYLLIFILFNYENININNFREAFEKNDEMIRLHENILNNLSELTIREISLHSNFKTLNENYNNLLNLQSQLNVSLHILT